MENVKQVAIYARVSTERQENEQTVQIQISNLREFALQNGLVIVDEYVDDGWSGDTLVRPALDNLRNDAKSGKWQGVVIYDPDRLARRYSFQELVMDELKSAGRKVIFMTIKAPENSEEKILYGVRGLFAEYEREKIRERFRLGKLRRVKDGHVINEAPYGYKYVKRQDQKPGYFEIVQEEARIVRMLFDMLENGITIRQIIVALHKKKISPSRSKRGVWASGRLSTLFRNTTYIGIAHFGKGEAIEPIKPFKTEIYKRNRKSSRRTRPEKEWVTIKVPAIISKEQFDKVQRQLVLNSERSKRNQKHNYLLTGIIYCQCGKRRNGETVKGNLYYRCSGRIHTHPLPHNCSAGITKGTKLESSVWQFVSTLMTSPSLLYEQLERSLKQQFDKNILTANTLPQLEQELETLKKQEARYLELYSTGILNINKLRQYLLPVQQQQLRVNDEISKIKPLLSAHTLPTKAEIEKYVLKTRASIEYLTFSEKRGIILNTVSRIISTKETCHIIGGVKINSDVNLRSNNWDSQSAIPTHTTVIPFEHVFNIDS